jgi:hypothetical protein
MSSSHRVGNHIVTVCWAFILLEVICGCGLIPQSAHHTSRHSEQRLDSPYQPYRVEQYCINTPPIFPAQLFHAAANALSERVQSLINPNSGGLALYVNLIRHNSIQGTVLSYKVPGFPADPLPPPQPAQTDNPYTNAAWQQAYQKAFAAWQAQLLSQHQQLAALRAQVKQWTDTLRSLNPRQFYDPIADDLYGCLDDASQHFQGVTGDKFLLIASPLINNTLVNASMSINLSGVHLVVVYRTCDVAAVCAASDAYWTKMFQQYGATSVKVLDVAQSDIEKPTF